MKSPAPSAAPELKLLSIVIPARDEEGCIASTVEHLHVELRLNSIPHEIIVVDDGSKDRTAQIVAELSQRIPEARVLSNNPPHGFGHAITAGLNQMSGDAAVVMMADESDDCRDVVRYWNKLNEGWDAVFGSPLHERRRRHRLSVVQAAASTASRISSSACSSGFSERHHKRLQGLSTHCDRRLQANAFGALQSHRRASPQDHHSRLFLDDDPDYVAQPQNRCGQVEDSGDGQPLSLHLPLSLA